VAVGRFVRLALLALLGLLLIGPVLGDPADAQALRRRAYLPFLPRDATPTPVPTPTPDPTCPSTGQHYDTIPATGGAPSPPADVNPDLNLTIRSWVTVNEARSLVDYNGGTDGSAPQLYSLFGNDRTPSFTSTHRVYDWDWPNNRRGAVLTNWPVKLLGMGTSPGEVIRLPRRSGGDIYQGVYFALVVYAEKYRISLHYARNDYIAPGYGLHLENVCVDPSLLALYQQANGSGRGQLPALRNNQPLGTARSGEILAAIRDTGTFMDPRSRKDWWAGRSAASVIVDPRDHTTPR
jgi:hypothetical protein